MDLKNKLIGHTASFTVYAIFGFNIIVCKDIATSNYISPIALFFLRSLFAGSLFWLVSLFAPEEKVDKKDFVRIFAASVLGFFFTQMTFLMAIPVITPMDCSIITALMPIFTMFIAAIALKEPVTSKKIGGVLVSFCGILLLIFNSVSATSGTAETEPIGIVLIVLNCICFSSYLGIFKPLISKYSPVTFMKWIFLFSTILSLPLAGKEVISIRYGALPLSFVLELMYLIIFATFIAYFLLPVGQRRIRPTLVSMYTYMQPIIATSVSIAIGMDTLNWQKILSAVMVFGGVVLVSRSRSRTER